MRDGRGDREGPVPNWLLKSLARGAAVHAPAVRAQLARLSSRLGTAPPAAVFQQTL